jgi:glycosyltransferase involved in cell wall biosynthesis
MRCLHQLVPNINVLSVESLKESSSFLNTLNIWLINYDQIHRFQRFLYPGKNNIAFFYMENEESAILKFRKQWLTSVLCEVWTGSTFSRDCILTNLNLTTYVIPPLLDVDTAPANRDLRKKFNLPEKAFLFMNSFDALSYTFRKNPYGVLASFKMAFGSNEDQVGLIFKINNAWTARREVKRLRRLAHNYKNIYFITDNLARNEWLGLLNTCDCVVSLHRSEGLGLVLAEAMHLKKPVIATNWSGNTDFMNHNNSCLVEYTRIENPINYGAYPKGCLWAEPNLKQAAEWMKKLVANPTLCQEIGERAKQTVLEVFSKEGMYNAVRLRLSKYLQL